MALAFIVTVEATKGGGGKVIVITTGSAGGGQGGCIHFTFMILISVYDSTFLNCLFNLCRGMGW